MPTNWKEPTGPRKPSGLQRVVIIFGLTASGKSTLAAALAEQFGLRVVHPSGVMRDLMEFGQAHLERPRANDGYWESEEGTQILSGRLKHEVPIDVAATQILLREVDRGEVVIDSWSLPWLTPVGLKFHLLADLETRSRRAAQRSGLSVDDATRRIRDKDEETRQLFLRLYGFDIFHDFESRFHHTLKTDDLSQEGVLNLISRQVRRHFGSRT